jgi:SAM-dependent methyltransferase
MPPLFDLLDFGCGPGRDLHTFKALGHRAVGLEGAPSAAALARAHSGCEVLEQSFLHLELPAQRYDGVFANAVLFHVPSQVLPQVLQQLQACLRPGGVLCSSNPRGDGQEGWNGERYGAFHDWPTWRALVTAAGFDELEHFYRPTGLPIEQQPWLACGASAEPWRHSIAHLLVASPQQLQQRPAYVLRPRQHHRRVVYH